jgi:hypothetical protein
VRRETGNYRDTGGGTPVIFKSMADRLNHFSSRHSRDCNSVFTRSSHTAWRYASHKSLNWLCRKVLYLGIWRDYVGNSNTLADSRAVSDSGVIIR